MVDVVRRYERWLHAVVNGRGHVDSGGSHDDLVQEGRVALWESHTKYDPEKGAEASFVTKAAEWRINEILHRGRPWTGQPSRQGKRPGTADGVVTHVEPLGDEYDAPGDDQSDEWAMARHNVEVHRAVAELPERQREYVMLRFWGGLTDREIQAQLGLPNDPGYLWRDRRAGARIRLRESLGYLADAA